MRIPTLLTILVIPICGSCYRAHARGRLDAAVPDGRDAAPSVDLHVVSAPEVRPCSPGEPCDCRAAAPIPAGIHWQGADAPSWYANFTPLHRVELTRDRWLGLYEVTAGCYHLCVWQGGCSEELRWMPDSEIEPGSYYGLTRDYWMDASYADLPIIDMARPAAAQYCAWVGGRLPTEVEWEKAARGESGRMWPWQDDPPYPAGIADDHEQIYYVCDFMHVTGLSGSREECPGTYAFIVPVGSYPQGRGPYGHHDLLGNAVEWVADSMLNYPVDSGELRVEPPAAYDPAAQAVLRGLPDAPYTFERYPEASVPDWRLPAYAWGVRCVFDEQPEPLIFGGDP